MLRIAAVAAVLAATPAAAVVVVGTTDFGTLPVGAYTGGGNGPGYFPATSDTSGAGRQAWRYTFRLTAPTHLYIGTSWNFLTEYVCPGDTSPCGGVGAIDYTDTQGIGNVLLALTPAGGRTRVFAPPSDLTDYDNFYYGEGYYGDDYIKEGYVNLKAGSYTLDFTGYGAAGGPAFPGSGGGREDTALSAEAVPEPATWALMLGGFAVTGAALRRRVLTASA